MRCVLICLFLVASVSASTLYALESWERCIYVEDFGGRCRNKREKGTVYCVKHEYAWKKQLEAVKNAPNRCRRIIGNKPCGSKTTEGSVYCYNCKQIVDEEVKRAAAREVAEECEKERVLREGAAAAAEAQRREMVCLIADGVGAAMGKRRCKWEGCTEFLGDGERYCREHKLIAKELIRMEEAERRAKRDAEASIKRCEARYTNGGQCRERTRPYSDYCPIHQGYVPGSPIPVAQQRKLETPEDYLDETKQRLDALIEAIEDCKSRAEGRPPDSLNTVRSLAVSGRMLKLSDAWGRRFYYETDGERYVVLSNGPDGVFETADDIKIVK